MKLSTVLENIKIPHSDIEDLVPKHLKGKDKSRTQGQTKKIIDKKTNSVFYKKTYHQLKWLTNEVNAYSILEMVNKAGRAYGYKTDVVPLTKMFKWKIDKDEDIPGDNIGIIITAGDSNPPAKEQQVSSQLFFTMLEKITLGKVLIGDGDFGHFPNFYKSPNQSRFYIFDFGFAFGYQNERYLNGFLQKQKRKIQDEKNTALKRTKLIKFIKYLQFWEFFLEHNESAILNAIQQNKKDIVNKITNFRDKKVVEGRSNHITTFIKGQIDMMLPAIKSTIEELNKQ